MENTVYLRMRQRVFVQPHCSILIKDIAQIIAPDELVEQLGSLLAHKIQKEDKNIVVIDLMQVIRKIQEVNSAIDIQTIGPSQTIIEVKYPKKQITIVSFIAVWLLLFIGTGLAVMNFHEDVSMQEVHQNIFYMMTGSKDESPLLLQIPYSIGLGVGMILFFNHIFRKRLNEEPSPLEVEMFKYQQDLDQYVAINENKESMKRLNDD